MLNHVNLATRRSKLFYFASAEDKVIALCFFHFNDTIVFPSNYKPIDLVFAQLHKLPI